MPAENRVLRLFVALMALAALALITVLAKGGIGLNATTVALLYLLVVLASSAFAGLGCGMAVALVSGLLVNYFFLPPFGTFYIEAPEDWVAFGTYAVTAAVFSHFAATVRRRAADADRLQAQLSQLSRFTAALRAVPKEELTLETIAAELRRAYGLSYCAIYNYDDTGTASPVISGTSPSHGARNAEPRPPRRASLLDVLAEEGTDVRCLPLAERGQTFGTLVISPIPLSPEVEEQTAAVVSLVIRQHASARAVG